MKWSLSLFCLICFGFALVGQQPEPKGPPPGEGEKKEKKGGFGGGFGKGGMFGGTRKLVKEFDKDGDGRLNAEERGAAREKIKADGAKGGFKGGKGFGGKGMGEQGKPGPKVAPSEVKIYPDSSMYDPAVMRTIFVEFENKDWEAELADFYRSDVEVPATLTVDGKKYPNVGIHFRGASSYFGVPPGLKHSMNLSMDYVDPKQKLYGYKTLNLLNSHDDPTFMHTTLFSAIARKYLPTPKANYVKLVVNGESWGIYVNAQQFNKEFLAENFGSSKGARWKIKGSPGGGGSLAYLGEDVASYKRLYELKSKEDEKAWKQLINLCKVLSTTPANDLEKALEPILDIDNALRFLAVDIALINDDGYWTRGSDYSIFLDGKGKFHVAPHDMNEAFVPGKVGMFGKGFGPPKDGKDGKDFKDKRDFFEKKEGKDGPPPGQGKDNPPFPGEGKKLVFPFPGGPGGMGGGSIELDPLIGLNDANKPLRSKLLAVPKFKEKYLEYVRAVARDGLDWKNLGPIVKQNRELIEKEIELDSRKLTSLTTFQKLTADTAEPTPPGGRGPGQLSLRAFADQRRAYLLAYEEGKKTAPASDKK